MAIEYETTHGVLQWDSPAYSIEYVDDPSPPKGDGWKLVGSVIGELRLSCQPILWFWARDVSEKFPQSSPA